MPNRSRRSCGDASAIFWHSQASVTGDAGLGSNRTGLTPRDVRAIEEQFPQPLPRRPGDLALPDLDLRRHHPRIRDAAQERVLFEFPVLNPCRGRPSKTPGPARAARRMAADRTRPPVDRDSSWRWCRRTTPAVPPSRDTRARMKSAGLATRSTASVSQIGSNAAPPGTAMRSSLMCRLRAATQNAAGAVRTRYRSKPRSRSSNARIDGSADIAPTATSSADRLATSAGNNSDRSGSSSRSRQWSAVSGAAIVMGVGWWRGRRGAGRRCRAVVSPFKRSDAPAPWLWRWRASNASATPRSSGTSPERLIGVDAAGDRQIKKTGDGRGDA